MAVVPGKKDSLSPEVIAFLEVVCEVIMNAQAKAREKADKKALK